MLSVTTRSAERNGMPALAPGPRSPNAMMETGHCDANSPSVSRSRESTWPPWSSWRAMADAVTGPAAQTRSRPSSGPRSLCAARRRTRRLPAGRSPGWKSARPPSRSSRWPPARQRRGAGSPTIFFTAAVTTTTAERSGQPHRPEHQQVSSGNAACLECLAHRLIARDQASPADLGGHPVRGAVADRHLRAGFGLAFAVPACRVRSKADPAERRTSVAIALPVMMARPRPRFRGRAVAAGMPVPLGAPTSAVLAWAGAAVSLRCRFGRRGSALVPWSCAFSRPACPSSWRPRLPPSLASGWPSPAPGWPSPRRGGLAALPAPPLGPAERGPAEGQPRGGGGPGLGGGSGCRSVSSVTWLGLGAGTAGGGSVGVFFGRVGSRAAGARPCCARGRLVRLPTSGARRAGCRPLGRGADAWACALSSAARMRCRSESDSSGLVNGPVPGPRFVPAHAVGEGSRPCPLPRQPPWPRARRRDRSKTEEHKTVGQSTQTGQLMTNKTCRY